MPDDHYGAEDGKGKQSKEAEEGRQCTLAEIESHGHLIE